MRIVVPASRPTNRRRSDLSEGGSRINTLLQRGVGRGCGGRTVETVLSIGRRFVTPLKRGVNRNRSRSRTGAFGRSSNGGFTMVEIAIAVAVIAFALVAIIGILPGGLQVPKEN